MVRKAFKKYLDLESSAGITLFFAAMVALVLKNSALHNIYDRIITTHDLALWVNDGLMSIFFFVVGLEIKREFIDGELSNLKTALLPILGAIGGMIFPALVYLAINYYEPSLWRGWAIPCATDIAFSLGILSLLGSRVRTSLKVFLTALAIIDDLGAILIIAFFYTSNFSGLYLLYALIPCAALFILNRMKVSYKIPFLIFGILLWYLVHHSGIHATIAGVLASFFIPYQVKNKSPLKELENRLHPIVAYFILPVFAFFNSGVSFVELNFDIVFSSLTLGIALGLFFGKQIGVMLFSWVSIKAGFARMPSESTWPQFYAVSILTGVGFTMSLFINNLAFTDPALDNNAKIGTIFGSILSGLVGLAILYKTAKKAKSLA